MKHVVLIALLSLSDGQPQAAGRQQTRTLILFCLSWNLGVISGNAAGGWLFAISARTALSLGLGLAAVHMLTNIAMAARTWLGGLVEARAWPRRAAAVVDPTEAVAPSDQRPSTWMTAVLFTTGRPSM